jgi:hypothetical protein
MRLSRRRCYSVTAVCSGMAGDLERSEITNLVRGNGISIETDDTHP